MRLTCARNDLAAALGAVGRIASSKSTIPVLALLLIRAEEGAADVAATDMEISLRVPLAASTEESGAVALPRVAADIVRSMPDGPVSVEHRQNEGVATISGGNSSFRLNCRQAEEFPELPPDEGEGLLLPADVFVETAEHVARAASRDETRPVLTGVLIRLGPDGLTMVATDSYRLAVKRADLPSPPGDARQAIVPARALGEVARLAGQLSPEGIEVVLTDSQALFRVGDARLTSRLIDGQFPDYRQLIPDSFDHEVLFDRSELAGVLARVGVLAQRGTPVRLAFTEGEVTLSAAQDQVGEGRESLPVPFRGEGFEVGFNVDFLRAGVDSIGDESVRMGLISPLRPGLLRGEGDDYRYLLMPIRLNA